MMKKGCTGHKIAWALVIIGGLNWGLVGAFGADWNVVNMLLGAWPVVERIVYVLVGLAAILALFGCKCKKCKADMGGMEKKEGGMGQQGMQS